MFKFTKGCRPKNSLLVKKTQYIYTYIYIFIYIYICIYVDMSYIQREGGPNLDEFAVGGGVRADWVVDKVECVAVGEQVGHQGALGPVAPCKETFF